MKTLQRVVWTEGMFMTPQHLQQQDTYHETLLDTRMAAVTPYAWGVVAVEIDTEALQAGQLQLLRLSAVLPDGSPVELERGDPEAPPARPIEEHFKASQRVLEVYLALPKERALEEDYTRDGTTQAPRSVRFMVSNRPTADLNAASSVVQVPFGQRNLMLLFGTESREDFDTLKLAEIVRDKSGALKLQETYIPPCLRIGTSPWLINELHGLLKTIMAKQRELAGSRKHRDASSVEFTSSDVTRFLQLNALNGMIPVLHHMLDTTDLPPQTAYIWLIQCAGQLFTFSGEGDPSSLPKFQFINLRATFSELFARLNDLLRPIALEQCITVPLEIRPDGLYLGKLDDERLARCSQFIITVRSDLAERMVADQFPRRAKVASRDEIHHLVNSAIPGVPIAVTFRPPPEVPIRPGVVYFTLAIQDAHWKTAMRERAMALYLPQPFEPSKTQLELLAVPSAAK